MKIFSSSLGPIYSGDVRDGLKKVIDDHQPLSVFIICDENTARCCVPKIEYLVDNPRIIVTKSGEQNKNLETCKYIWSALIEKGADRDSIILNVGGGVVCDMGGFAAACFQRGIRFGHIPTTLLSMSDASIGGKLGVDYKGFKNYIGLIQNPSFIWIDPSFLETLPPLEITSGMAEIVKHAIIGSQPLWDIVSGVKTINELNWAEIFEENIAVKVKIVESDLREQGLRKVLNFGHTIGHALESFYLASRNPVTHGQCVAIGMLTESRIAVSMGLLNSADFESITQVISRLLSPEVVSLPGVEMVLPWIGGDKKKSKGRVGFSLPDKIGSCGWDIPVEENAIIESFEWVRAQVKSVPFR
ncbi:MAG: 3-dehydroquinate synthase [Saprospiraceae bacterium]|uniref:3-dehydroquinate synthase n=1 Tax=Candidatus Opimibacter skivensis TaxID=2982028 RepID=A0A9D7SZD1_9BACT|nr:3-dehydroquinate synthase [Candidatus Opimibacter skivensis]